MASLFKTRIKELKGVGPRSAELLEKLGVNTIGDLICFYPRDYEDWSKAVSLSFAVGKKQQCVKIKVVSPAQGRNFGGRKSVYKVQVTDGANLGEIVFFNNKFTANSLKHGETYMVRGNVTKQFDRYQIVSPKINKSVETIGLKPVYRQTAGITSSKIAKFVKSALELLPECVPETLPDYIVSANDLCTYDFAVKNIHFPKSVEDLNKARERLVFEEFFVYQLCMGAIKNQARAKTDVVIKESFCNEFFKKLPFELTEAQKRVISECMNDLGNGEFAMNRLLQGDVGSGKTVVAATLAYCAAKSGYQSAVMAPTEILAQQHYKTFCDFFDGSDIEICLLSGSVKPKQKKILQEKIALGEAKIVIGTHALISDNVSFKNLGLAITDEQHRFGVKQRGAFSGKSSVPHVLVMSATPIPRTLALIVYGDLDISILDSVLPGRQKINTFKIDSGKRVRALNFLKDIVKSGGQGYIVCAGIDENENDIVDLNTYYDKYLNDIFKKDEVGILHGKMRPDEKELIMKDFVDGKTKVLVSTTVIEVGVDVPNAQLMIIENAERFGISQLHQLRGRVGRSNKKSYCVLISDSKSRDSVRRFDAMTFSSDGFYLSEEDLKLRGPGDFFGVNQHGVPNINIQTKYEDICLVKRAQNAACELLKSNVNFDDPQFRFIKSKIKKHFSPLESGKTQGIIF